MAQSGSGQSVLVFFVFLIMVVVLRIRRVIYGTRVSVARSVGYSIYYVAFAALFLALSYYERIPTYYFAIYAALLVGAALASFIGSKGKLRFWKDSNGNIFAKGGIIIYVIYIVGLVARLAIEYIFIGPSAFFSTQIQSLSPIGVVATIFTDLLLVLGAGLLVGRNAQILKRFGEIKAGREILSTE